MQIHWFDLKSAVIALFFSVGFSGCGIPLDLSNPVPRNCDKVTPEMLATDTLPPYTTWQLGKEDGWPGSVRIREYGCGQHEVEERTWFATNTLPERVQVLWREGTAWNYFRGSFPTNSVIRRYWLEDGVWKLYDKEVVDNVKEEQEYERRSWRKFPH